MKPMEGIVPLSREQDLNGHYQRLVSGNRCSAFFLLQRVGWVKRSATHHLWNGGFRHRLNTPYGLRAALELPYSHPMLRSDSDARQAGIVAVRGDADAVGSGRGTGRALAKAVRRTFRSRRIFCRSGHGKFPVPLPREFLGKPLPRHTIFPAGGGRRGRDRQNSRLIPVTREFRGIGGGRRQPALNLRPLSCDA